jgi:poly-gamma-glutamate synthesis protein (capsule biosynthesis protein)
LTPARTWFVGHGPHVLRGIEVYKGKPIFYSLANFIFQNETVLRMPEDSYEEYSLSDDAQPADYLDARYDKDRRSFPADREYWDSVAVLTKWEGGNLSKRSCTRSRLDSRRRDRNAAARSSRRGRMPTRILETMIARSKAFGATVTVKGGVGVVRRNAASGLRACGLTASGYGFGGLRYGLRSTRYQPAARSPKPQAEAASRKALSR